MESMCILRNYQKLTQSYNSLFDKHKTLQIENKNLKYGNEYTSKMFQKSKKFYLQEIQNHIIRQNNYLKEIGLLKQALCSNTNYKADEMEKSLQKRIECVQNTVDSKMTELEQLHWQIFNNSQISKWAKDCNKLEIGILSCLNEEIYNFVLQLVDQLNEKNVYINDVEKKLFSLEQNPLAEDDKNKQITSDIYQHENANEKMLDDESLMYGLIQRCKEEIKCLKENQETISKLNERLVESETKIKEKTLQIEQINGEMIVLVKAYHELVLKQEEINNELETTKINNNLLTLKLKEQNKTIKNDDLIKTDLNNKIISAEEILKIKDLELIEIKKEVIRSDTELKNYAQQNNQLQSDLKSIIESNNDLSKKFNELNNASNILKTRCDEQNKITEKNDRVIDDLKKKIISMEEVSRIKDSKVVEIKQKLTQCENDRKEYVQQNNDLQSACKSLNKAHNLLSIKFNELNDENQALKIQFDEQTKTIESKNYIEQLLSDKLNSAKEISRIKDAELIKSNRQVIQLTEELNDLTMKKKQLEANYIGVTKLNNELIKFKENTTYESKTRNSENEISKIKLDKRNETIEVNNYFVGKDTENKISYAKENSIKDNAEKENEKSEEYYKLLADRKHSSKQSKVLNKLKGKNPKTKLHIMATRSMVSNEINLNLTSCANFSCTKKNLHRNMNDYRRSKYYIHKKNCV